MYILGLSFPGHQHLFSGFVISNLFCLLFQCPLRTEWPTHLGLPRTSLFLKLKLKIPPQKQKVWHPGKPLSIVWIWVVCPHQISCWNLITREELGPSGRCLSLFHSGWVYANLPPKSEETERLKKEIDTSTSLETFNRDRSHVCVSGSGETGWWIPHHYPLDPGLVYYREGVIQRDVQDNWNTVTSRFFDLRAGFTVRYLLFHRNSR